ncbi:MAG TPA: cupin domain-containing protein [Acidimicrobiales bacterium]|nr:cupin domain-containing protein [Acidimicrobiales bacterium]
MTDVRFIDVSGHGAAALEPWEPVVIPARALTAEADRLAARPRPANGRRESVLAHPRARGPGLGLAPGIRVTLSVLAPGERTRPLRHNSTAVGFCIEGGGTVDVDGTRIEFGRYDVWNHPSFRTYHYENDTDERQVRLTYSNAPVLEHLGVHIVEDDPDAATGGNAVEIDADDERRRSPFGTITLSDVGALLMPYETLINPPAVTSKALHWPWADVKAHLDKLDALGDEYVGRRLYLLYNPVTGRTNGTTPSFFATMTIRPPGIVDRPHRHVSAAINYFFHGRGYSRIAGRRYEWQAGDLMFTAPGWAIHHHASGEDDHVYELTVQDQPFHIGAESLLWQEDLARPARVLGSEPGFETNR